MAESLVSEAIGHLIISSVPSEFLPVEAILLIKTVDENGKSIWFIRSTAGLSDVEQLGILHGAVATTTAEIVDSFEED